GCGLGLLAHALRQDGQEMPYYGVDNDADKIGRAIAAAERKALAPARFEVVDLAHHLPRHQGSVAILDVLQYLRAPAQRQLLENVIAMLTPGARLVIRTGLVDGSRRGLVSRIGDRAANLIGWMQSSPRCYPDADGLRAILEGAGLQVTIEPLWGRTPFNNWLVVGQTVGRGYAPDARNSRRRQALRDTKSRRGRTRLVPYVGATAPTHATTEADGPCGKICRGRSPDLRQVFGQYRRVAQGVHALQQQPGHLDVAAVPRALVQQHDRTGREFA